MKTIWLVLGVLLSMGVVSAAFAPLTSLPKWCTNYTSKLGSCTTVQSCTGGNCTLSTTCGSLKGLKVSSPLYSILKNMNGVSRSVTYSC